MIENKNLPIVPFRSVNGAVVCNTEEDTGYIKGAKPMMGLTKREWFAGMTLSGICANTESTDNGTPISHEWTAERAIKIADEILKQLEK